jgi:hypothetical protein
MLQKQNPAYNSLSLSELEAIDLNSLNTVERIQVRQLIKRLRVESKKKKEKQGILRSRLSLYISIIAVVIALLALIYNG